MTYNVYIKKEKRLTYHENKKYKYVIKYKNSIFTYTNVFYMAISMWRLVWFTEVPFMDWDFGNNICQNIF